MKDNKEKIIGYILVIISVAILVFEFYFNYKQTGEIDTNKLGQALNIVTDEIDILNQSSTEIPELTEVIIYAVSQNWGKTDKGWICLDYTSRDIDTLNIQNTVGISKKLLRASILYSNSNLTGTKYNYKANTTIKILKNISSTVDYVYVVKTGRYAYVKVSAYK